jgi:hypothetical protein
MTDELLAFSLTFLTSAKEASLPLEVCKDGHLVVRGNTHWQVERLSNDLTSVLCRMADHETHPDG